MRGFALKIIYFSIPTLILAISILTLNSGQILKRPMTGTDDVRTQIQTVASHAVGDRWGEAERSVSDLYRAWEQVKRRVAITTPADLMADLDLEMAELRAAVEAQDAAQVRTQHRRLEVLWEDLGG
jgi:ppGpp synthetase/RelA/SpoT-type nucleotidyltranferase